MASDEVLDLASCRKVAQLDTVIKYGNKIEYIESILQEEGNINYKVKHYDNGADADGSLLHLAYSFGRFDVFELFINNGADFTVQDCKSFTVLHKIIQKRYKLLELDESEDKFMDCVLSAHVKFDNHSNPRCKDNISHFHVACLRNNAEAVELFLRNGVDVNQAVNMDSPFFAGYTPLHFAVRFSSFEVAKVLLKYGPNIDVKNAAGLSPLAQLMKRKVDGKNWGKRDSDESVLTLLAKYIINQNEDLTRLDNYGLSNIHVACITKDTSVLVSLLEKISDIGISNRPVQINSPLFPGYTPLHFAAISSIETVKLLLAKGADIEAKNANTNTPFDLCLQNYTAEDIHYLISSQTRWKNITLSDGQTKLLDIIAAMTSIDEFIMFLANIESIVDLIVPRDSPLWPGYTVLHLAVVFSEKTEGKSNHVGSLSGEKNIVEECLLRDAEVSKSDIYGLTALHLAFQLQKFFTVQTLLQYHQTTENLTDKRGLSHFHIACAAGDESVVERFLSSGVDVNVPINSIVKWQVLVASLNDTRRYSFFTEGFTALHIGVTCGHEKICKMLLENDADIYATDIYGFTPVHLLFPICTTPYHNDRIDNLLLNYGGLQDRTAEGGLTHLHVVCYSSNNLNVKTVERLLDSGACIGAVITYDTTNDFSEEDSSTNVYGDPLKKPLSFLSRYQGFTPLHFSIHKNNRLFLRCLVRRGADVFAENFLKYAPIREILKDSGEWDFQIVLLLMNNNVVLNRLRKDFGVTRLHIACYVMKLEWIRDSLQQGDDVNSRVNEKSPFWSGNTGLHLAAVNVMNSFEDGADFMEIFELLLDRGADVTLENHNADTPLHLVGRQLRSPAACCRYAPLLLRYLKDFDVEVAHSQKMSFFHFACLLKNVPIVEIYLLKGIDVNRPVDFFDERHPGCSPLHLAIHSELDSVSFSQSQVKIIGLLLKYGADIRAKDVYNNTLLHNAIGFLEIQRQLWDTFMRCGLGLDVNAENILGETALETLIKSRSATWEDIQWLIKHGSRINTFNSITQEGCVAIVLSDPMGSDWEALDMDEDTNDIIQNLVDSEYVGEVDGDGRTIFHNLVSVEYFDITDSVELIRRLVQRGCKINQQDKDGRTALHIATWFRNNRAVVGLLKNGADINVTDKNGKTAFSYCFETSHDRNAPEDYRSPYHVMHIFTMHVYRMERCRLYTSEMNKRLQNDALQINNLDERKLNGFNSDVEKSKYMNVGSPDLTLYDFGFKIDAEMVYPSMPILVRLEIDQFFKNIYQHNLSRIDYMLKQKYESCVERLRLIDLAVESFSNLIKNQLPDLCCRVVLSFLSRSDLKNIIALEDL